MGLTNGLSTVEAVWLMLLYVLPMALAVALVVLVVRWLTKPDHSFSASEPDATEEHHEPPQ